MDLMPPAVDLVHRQLDARLAEVTLPGESARQRMCLADEDFLGLRA